jgi:hypothetical protein
MPGADQVPGTVPSAPSADRGKAITPRRDGGSGGRAGASYLLVRAAPIPAAAATGGTYTAAAGSPEPALDRVATRRRGRDTTRPLGAISAQPVQVAHIVAAAAATAAATSAGVRPAMLVTVACLLILSFLAVLRAARLERPG